MKLFLDYIPIVLFFIAYKITNDIFLATGIAVGATLLQIVWLWMKKQPITLLIWVNLGIMTTLGTVTIILHDDVFIKWKPTVLYLFFASALLLGLLFKKNFIRLMLQKELSLPTAVWNVLSISWAIFFLFLAFLNWYIAFHWSYSYCNADAQCAQNIWVQFKVFGTLALIFAFVLLQGAFLMKYLSPTTPSNDEEKKL